MKNIKSVCCILCLLLFSSPVMSLAKTRVVVSIPPQQWLCKTIGGEDVTVQLLVEKGQDPHGFEPTPKQIQAISRAALFFTADLEFEKEVARRLREGAPGLRVVDTSSRVEKLDMDPHIWLSPLNLQKMATVIKDALLVENPGRRDYYNENLKNLNRQLDKLHKQTSATLAPFAGKSFFVFHPAFGYFAHSYNLKQVAVETGGKSPTPRQLFSLIKQARKDGIRVIFVQPQFDPRSVATVAKAIDGEVVPLDPLAANVEKNIKTMATKIVQALTAKRKQ